MSVILAFLLVAFWALTVIAGFGAAYLVERWLPFH